MKFLNTILNIIFPVNCISCRKSGQILCIECLSNSPLPERENPNWIFSLFDYRHPPVKKAIWFLKYNGKKNIAGLFASIIHSRIIEELSDLSPMENFNKIILIPIPLAPKRKRERGFNQAELICKNLLKIHKESTPTKEVDWSIEKNILIKPKDTEHQAKIEDRSKRLKNIIGSFVVKNKELIKNRNIILIDDVTTTGATLNEAKKVLKQAGARKIIAFTVAH